MNEKINLKVLEDTVSKLMLKGKGILAADESNSTCDKRLATVGVSGSEEVRRQYRQMLLEMPGLEEFVSGVILYSETFWQNNNDGISFPQSMIDRGIVPGIKVDIGAKDFPGFPGEKLTVGLDDLPEKAKEYFDAGARFGKWRAVIRIDENGGLPTEECIEANADALGRYARILQEAGLVPIVEPEVLLEGTHSIDKCQEVISHVLEKVFEKCNEYRAYIPGIILKTSMVISGNANPEESSAEEVAEKTVKVLLERVPKDIGGVVFLSGGQTPVEATVHLDAIAEKEPLPFEIAFSYGRALQEPALKAWAGKEENVERARVEFLKRLKLNQLADDGDYDISFEYLD